MSPDLELTAEEGESILHGEVVRTAKKDYGDWSWASIFTDDKRQVKIVGDFGLLRLGTRVTVVGKPNQHPVYGEELLVRGLVEDLPRGDAVVRWLMATLPGIGPVRAQECVQRWGSGLWGIIEKEPMALRVLGLSEEQVNTLVAAYNNSLLSRDFYIAGLELGLNLTEVRSVWKRNVRDYPANERTWDRYIKDPHELYHSVHFSFARTQELISQWKVEVSVVDRIAAGVCEVLRAAARDGNTVLDLSNVYAGLTLLFHDVGIAVTDAELDDGVEKSVALGRVVDVEIDDQPYMALKRYRRAERSVCAAIFRMRVVEANLEIAKEVDDDNAVF